MMKQLNGFQRGINLGGWLSQCTPKKEHYDTFITEQDLRTIASWGSIMCGCPLITYWWNRKTVPLGKKGIGTSKRVSSGAARMGCI